MRQSWFSCAILALAVGGLRAEDPFVRFEDIPKEELLDVTKPVTIAKDGSLLVGGQPHYFPATMWYGGIEFPLKGLKQNPGDTPPELRWLYADYPNYETAQRLGIDAAGTVAPLAWMKRLYRPTMRDEPKDWAARATWEKCGLSMYVDYTASEWSHGSMWYHSDRPLDPDYVKPKPGTAAARAEAKLVAAKKAAKARLESAQGKKGKGPSLDEESGGVSLDEPEVAAADAARRAKEDAALVEAPDPGHLPPEAWTVGHNHWMPYSIVHPKGRRIWLHMWQEGAKDLLAHGVKPWCYELLNEPACSDESDYAKKVFAGRMKARFGKDWEKSLTGVARRVEYAKFIEECFGSLLSEGAAWIRAVDPTALVTFQPCTIRTAGIDLYRSYRDLSVVCSQTGGRGMMEAHLLRGLADGKPIVDNEMYIGNTTNSIRGSYLDQYQRGFNVSYSFKWEANKSGYNFMNRKNVSPGALLGIRLAKRDIMDVNEFFTPRDRGTRRTVAVHFSSPTERLSQCAGRMGYKFFDQAICGVDFAHLNPDVIYEDQMTNGVARLSRYRVLVSAGVDATYPGTLKSIRSWVEKGGIWVVIAETAALDEYGEANPDAFTGLPPKVTPIEGEQGTIELGGEKVRCSPYSDAAIPSDWKTLAALDGKPVIGIRRLGEGAVLYANVRLPGAGVGALVRYAASLRRIRPMCETRDAEGGFADNIEVHDAARGGMRAWSICARTMGDRLIRFRPAGERPEKLIRVWNEVTGPGRMVAMRQELQPDGEGYYALYLTAGRTDFYVAGTAEQLAARYPKTKGRWLEPLAYATTFRAGMERLAEEKAKRQAEHPAFDVDPDKVHPLDLRPFVNRRFVDKVAGDGKDGWTDQGVQHSLTDTPWGIVNCNGVPMDFIRYDQNNYRDCLVMASTRLKAAPKGEMPYPVEVRGIKVDRLVGNAYFLHALAWGILNRVETAWTYVVNYGDGSKVEVPVRNYREAWDWGFIASTAEMAANDCVRGWTNGANKGLYLWRWRNPYPEKRVATIDIVSANGQQIPLIAAISVEEPGAKELPIPPTTIVSRGGSKGVRSSYTNGVWKVALDDNATSWSTAGVNLTTAVPVGGQKLRCFKMEVNRLPDAWGNYHDHATPQFRVNGRDKDGKLVFGNWMVAKHPKDGSMFYRTDNDPDSWETCVLYMSDGFLPKNMEKVISISLQFQVMPQAHSGLAFRNFAFEYDE